MRKILIVQGPNLNLLGNRERQYYGSASLDEVHAELRERGGQEGLEVVAFQSNHEGDIVDTIQGAPGNGFEAIIINPAAYTHTSVAIRDALTAVGLPYFEVHISNIQSREDFRRRSLVSEGASGIVSGFGPFGYTLALLGAAQILDKIHPTGGEDC
ncbi:MAG: type II 3-dehydroquinate dehydratase [Deltaproteobacteria bacterium]|nr:type II 3-dehydroquinate dehydratase [Deltaproteobacteria bacterium]